MRHAGAAETLMFAEAFLFEAQKTFKPSLKADYRNS